MYLTTLHKYLENNCNFGKKKKQILGTTGSCLLNIPRSAWETRACASRRGV